MTTLMVHLELGRGNTRRLQVTADLADRINADVIGIAAAQPIRIVYGDAYASGDLVERNREDLKKEIADAEAEFRSALGPHRENLEWRSAVTLFPTAGYVAEQARVADLLITGVDQNESLFDSSHHMDISELIMQLGRPALIVPAATEKIRLDRMLIGWKDTRESRRTALDALPLMKMAVHVAVCEIAPKDQIAAARNRLADVVGWLMRNGIVAEPVAAVATGDDVTELHAIASAQAADVIVAGAYGHSRLREWVLGGVTRDLLLHADRCSFVSH